MKNDKYTVTLLSDYTPPPFLIETANLEFTLDPKTTIVKAQLHIKRNQRGQVLNREFNQTCTFKNGIKIHDSRPDPVGTKDAALKLNGINLELQEVKINGQPLPATSYQVDPEYLTLPQVPDDFILETTVKISPESNLSCIGLYLSNGNFCTQNEPHGFRQITYFLDRPDILTKFTTAIIADKDKYPVLLSNGNLIETNHHRAVWQDPYPKSPYLFALVAGNFSCLEDQYTTGSGRKVTIKIFADQKYLDQCHYAILFLKQAMLWEEQNFGLEYDLDLYQIVGINDFNFGAMENKGLNIFNTSVLLTSPLTATDTNFLRVATVIAHEYFHNWTGNRVTCRDWFQLGLKEGLTSLREQLFMEDLYGQTTNRIDTIKAICTKQFAEDSGPLAHPVRLQSYIEINNFYTYTVYDKGAEIARMLITIFGRKVFVQILHTFLTKFDGQAVTIEDFIQTAADITNTNLEQFKLWYDQCGTPQLTISDDFTDGTYFLQIKQEHPKAPKDFSIPLAFALLNPNGENTPTEVLIINKEEQSFSFKNLPSKPIPSLLRNFSAPVKIQYPYSDEELLFLVGHDQDPINRYEASQKLMTNIICRNVQTLPSVLIQTFKNILSDKNINPALAAEILKLPTESYLFEVLSEINIEEIHYACEFIQTELAIQLKNEFLACYHNNNTKQPYNTEALSIGRRELKNTALHYLMCLDTPEVFSICCEQLEQADNLTDILASITALANSTYENREQILEEYYQKWADQPNLVDKWLVINANIKAAGTLQRVKGLLNHPAFNLKNPNKVYSLIRTFCENNHINFHAVNGDGYQFLAEQILAIDKFNPSLAAHIATPLTCGDKLDKPRQQLMQQQLIRINREPGLSKNVYEITAKAIMII